MHSKESIYNHVVKILVELFEIDPQAVRPDASLVDDLDIDSIDAVDIAVEMQTLTGSKIQPEDFKDISTVQNLADAAFKRLSTQATENSH